MRVALTAYLLVLLFYPLKAQQTDTIKLGFLIQETYKNSASNGALLAATIINERGGISGKPVKVIVKGMEGPWGTGSTQAVSLIFEDNVWALLGSHDGRNAHLVEQAATKSIVVFVNAWSSDPTLTQTYVPWFFNCMPNDKQQGEALIEDIYTRQGFKNVVTICDDSYDSKQALTGFIKYLRPQIHKQPKQLQYEGISRLPLLYSRIQQANPECMVIFCRPSAALSVARFLKEKQVKIPMYGTLTILDENELSIADLRSFNQVMKVADALPKGPKYNEFRQRYMATYGKTPGLVAAYAFDAANVLMEAIKKAGVKDREKIQHELNNLAYEGLTGVISFHENGDRVWQPSMVKVNF